MVFLCGRAGRLTAKNGGVGPVQFVVDHEVPCFQVGPDDDAGADAVGLDEGFLPFSLPILVHMEDPYSKNQ
jgi:hypothetical protein